MKNSRYVRLVLGNLAIFFLLVFSLEGSFRVLEWQSDQPLSHVDFRMMQPEPYKDSHYFSSAFIRESFSQPGGHSIVPGTQIIMPNDYEGEFFNVKDGRRVTTSTPLDASSRLYLFGGSTVYCSEVPDELTIASQLQDLINDKGLGIEVVNMGVTTITTSQQLEQLRRLEFEAGDWIVFYDGANDAAQGIYYGNPDGQLAFAPRDATAFVRAAKAVARVSATVRWAQSNFGFSNATFDAETIQETARLYVSNLKAAAEITSAGGGNFYHFLQPTLASKAQLNDYELDLIGQKGVLVDPNLYKSYKVGYSAFRESGLAELDWSVDISNAFDSLITSPYLDIVHVNEIGNSEVAKAIFREIFG